MKKRSFSCRPVFILTLLSSLFLLSCSQTKNQPSLSNLELGFYKSDLEFIKWNLDTSFTSSILDYSTTVEKFYTDSIYITVTDSSSIPFSTKIEGKEVQSGVRHKVSPTLGENLYEIELSAKKGKSKTYQLKVTREDHSLEYVPEKIGDGMWRITDFGGFAGNEDMYLIEGKDKALLFDTGMGKGDLPGFIRTLTNLPVDIAITHGNRDHFGQVDQFKESTVYMSEKDKSRLPAEFITPKFRWVKEGDKIDIGNGRSYEILEIPGHTTGCIIFYDERNKIAVTGDGIGSGDRVHMFGSLCASVEVYIDALKKIEQIISNLDGLNLLVGHHYQEKTPLNGIAGKQLFSDMRILSEKIMSGEITGKPAKTVRNGETINLMQAYYGLAGLWYNPDNLRTTGKVN